jgi:hypothetical protein
MTRTITTITIIAALLAFCLAGWADGAARQSYSWADVKDKPWQKLPELDRGDLADITGYIGLSVQDLRDRFVILPGDKNTFGPVQPYAPDSKDNLAVFGADYRSYSPVVAEKPEEDTQPNNCLNLRAVAGLPDGEMFCMIRYATKQQTSVLGMPRDLLFVRKRFMDKIDKSIEPGPRYVARLLQQPALSNSIIGWYDGMGEKLIVIDTCLGPLPRFDGEERAQWIRRYLAEPLPKHDYKDRKWVKEEDAKDDTIGDYKVREFSDGKFYLKKTMIGNKEFWYVENDLDTLKKNWDFVQKIGDLKSSDLATKGWEMYTETSGKCEKLNELIKDDQTIGQIVARFVDFLGSCKYYWADSWGWLPLDYMMESEKFDCDSSAKIVINALRLKGFPCSLGIQPGHGWTECYLPGTGFVIAIDMTAGNSKIYRATNEMLAYEFDKGVLEGKQTVEDMGLSDSECETGDGPSEATTVFMQSWPDWYVIGPFDYPNEKSYDLVYPPEKEQIIGKTYPGKGGVTCEWRRPFEGQTVGCARYDAVDYLSKYEWYIAYALGFVRSPVERTAELRIGTDDTAKVWLNDQLVDTCKIHRGINPDDDIVPIKLQEGWNKFLIKIGQGVGGAGFMMRITDPEGNRIPDLVFTPEPWGIDPTYASIYVAQPTEFVAIDGKQKVVAEVVRGDVAEMEARFRIAGDGSGGQYAAMAKGDDGKYTVELDPAGYPSDGTVLEVRAHAPDGRLTVATKPMRLATTGLAPDGQGYIRDWLLAGPFPNEGDHKGFDVEYLDPAAAEFTVGGQVESTAWKPVPPNKYAHITSYRSPYINFVSMFDKTEYVFAYAGTYVYSPDAQSVKLAIGSDDAVKAWLNGSIVLAHKIGRGAAPDQDTSSVSLKKGWNKLLVKVGQGVGGWGMYVRFLDANGQPIRNLQISAEKPAEGG